ncbi:hypothetical protein Cme02nite_73340 [Catellatospora methionotrophica]|uniref:Uncharacterized protein n=1 Tax=Catellatospora methionotrophica TaxID=121620 RepID=A0A8J3LE18_9ACTN|nr:hypothetical protein [Catellatospora methionotrophica]GIG19002.1 hypothetical protein Cme02nite_73340 [Catellatospora methionotrophica]
MADDSSPAPGRDERRRPGRGRSGKTVLAALAVAALVAGSAWGLSAVLDDGAEGRPTDAGSLAAYACPAHRDGGEDTTADRGGSPFVPEHATKALLCAYRQTGDTLDLSASTPLPGSADEVTALLNDAPRPADRITCLAMDREQYQIVLGYGDGRSLLVEINANCGTAVHGESVRRLVSLSKLLSYWPV